MATDNIEDIKEQSRAGVPIVSIPVLRKPVGKIKCPEINCGFMRFIWSWKSEERDRVWEWIQLHYATYHKSGPYF